MAGKRTGEAGSRSFFFRQSLNTCSNQPADTSGEPQNDGFPSIDWSGHRVVVRGYDTRGTGTVLDEVSVFADSVNCHDDLTDGGTYFNEGESDAHHFLDAMRDLVWIVAAPAIAPLPSLRKKHSFFPFYCADHSREHAHENHAALYRHR